MLEIRKNVQLYTTENYFKILHSVAGAFLQTVNDKTNLKGIGFNRNWMTKVIWKRFSYKSINEKYKTTKFNKWHISIKIKMKILVSIFILFDK